MRIQQIDNEQMRISDTDARLTRKLPERKLMCSQHIECALIGMRLEQVQRE
jgi:hypothetical protein